ncbi:hypothetical protein CROQUDRAFT_657716 [Cronartium quercuum f. sp. fusiforme G11]|uniref:Wax synthase domain-containing protein n=1 Tax=Cronartium quercuum f. sp. fusiforme G11 TaxID=708437 RepID=A0A9P6TBG2_9BASI|nr:hypothetical protein CROQUDRAFT_657716 [Cronartium quercuum f. sp. fusiforme G11]
MPHNQSARLIRIGLIPITLVFLIFSGSQWRTLAVDGWIKFLIGCSFNTYFFQTLVWGMASEPYYKLADPNPTGSIFDRLSFAISLHSSPRGIGWSFGVPVKASNQTRIKFLYDTLRRLSFNLLIIASSSISLGVININPSAPSLLLRYLMTFFVGTLAWTVLDSAGCIIRLFALAFNQDLSEYPFFLDSPIQGTNLADFWSRRWHSLLKHVFVEVGGRPIEGLVRHCVGDGILSRTCLILGTFTVSGLEHEFSLWFATSLEKSFRTTLFFFAQGLGVILEAFFFRKTGKKVGGWIGRVWMFFWLIFWGRFMIDALIEKGVV